MKLANFLASENYFLSIHCRRHGISEFRCEVAIEELLEKVINKIS